MNFGEVEGMSLVAVSSSGSSELSGPLPSIGYPISRRQVVEIINPNHWLYADTPGRNESRVRGGP